MDGVGRRLTREWKCQVSVGELYRWILAKLSDKDIKRALHKYRDLMPRQSDWNRKLTQATNVPELGFRYLYRCGQIDESNHRTMQKMLKYIDRQDVLPYFDTILYNTNNANCSLEELKKVLIDKVDAFLQYSTALTEEEVHPDQPYEVIQCQPLENRRVTRAQSKRKSTEDPCRCVTTAKRGRRSSDCPDPTDSFIGELASNCCGQVRSAIVAGALGGPAIHAILSSSLISMLSVLRMTLTQNCPPKGTQTVTNPTPETALQATPVSGLSPARIIAAMPHLMALARIQLPTGMDNLIRNPQMHPGPPQMPRIGAQAQAPNMQRIAAMSAAQAGRQYLTAGGVGITASANDSCIYYYCRIRLRIRIDMGSSKDLLNRIHVERQDPYARQMDMFVQASNFLRHRCAGEYVCSLRFNQLDQLESFWNDYLSGSLKEMLMENLIGPSTHSLFGQTVWAPQSPTTYRGPSTSSRYTFTEPPADALARSLRYLRAHLATLTGGGGGGVPRSPMPAFDTPPMESTLVPDPVAPDFDLNLFVSKREYDNGRLLLMRNTRTIPSLCRLVAASNFLPGAASASSTNASTQTPAATSATHA